MMMWHPRDLVVRIILFWDIKVYIDADWKGSLTDRRSTSRYCSYLWGNLVIWCSKKQPSLSRSSAEAEFRALALGICEGIWLRRILKDLQFSTQNPVKLYRDNISALKLAENPIHHDKTKHIEIDKHYIKERNGCTDISLSYIPSKAQVADMFTKVVLPYVFKELCPKLGCINIYSYNLEGECGNIN